MKKISELNDQLRKYKRKEKDRKDADTQTDIGASFFNKPQRPQRQSPLRQSQGSNIGKADNQSSRGSRVGGGGMIRKPTRPGIPNKSATNSQEGDQLSQSQSRASALQQKASQLMQRSQASESFRQVNQERQDASRQSYDNGTAKPSPAGTIDDNTDPMVIQNQSISHFSSRHSGSRQKRSSIE